MILLIYLKEEVEMYNYKYKVKYYETDMQGIVHHSNYLRYLENAREELIENFLGMTSLDFGEMGIFYVIREATTKFIYPIKFGDDLSINVRLAGYNGVKLTHEYEFIVNGNVHATAKTVMVSIDKLTFKPFSVRKRFLALHEKTLELLKLHNIKTKKT